VLRHASNQALLAALPRIDGYKAELDDQGNMRMEDRLEVMAERER
jgi:hypothetical protein